MSDGSMSQEEINDILSRVDPPMGTKGIRKGFGEFTPPNIIEQADQMRKLYARADAPGGHINPDDQDAAALRRLHDNIMQCKQRGIRVDPAVVGEYCRLAFR
jgi:hypothetical protein